MQQLRHMGRLRVLGLCLLVMSACTTEDTPTPRTDADPFDLTLALALARLNLQAYQQLDHYRDDRVFVLPAPYRLEAQLVTAVHFAGDIFAGDEIVPIGFIASADNAIYVVFRGTKAISEWLGDVTFTQEDFAFVADSGRTHQGFTSVYQHFRLAMITAVRNLINTGTYTRLYVVGHSLGGALAVLATLELRERTTLEPLLYNYGAPRVGDRAFRDRYRALIRTSWRVVNTNDVVPDVPPTSLIDGFPPREIAYQHVLSPREITFGRTINDPLDVFSIRSNHNLCNHYNALCAETNDVAGCRALADGVDDCNR